MLKLLELVLPCIALVLAAILLVTRGMWPKRAGQTPFCRRCSYNLTGSVSGRCPECGTLLSEKAIIHGTRHPRPRRMVMGVLCAILAVSWWVLFDRLIQTDWHWVWYRCLPSGSLLTRLDTKDRQITQRAWRVLTQRADGAAGNMDLQKQIVAACLRHVGDEGSLAPTEAMRGYLARCYIANQLSEAEAAQFLTGLFKASIWVRPRVVKGDPVPYEEVSAAKNFSSDFRVEVTRGPLYLDGTVIRPGGPANDAGDGCCWPLQDTLACDGVGRHILMRTTEFELLRNAGPLGSRAGTQAALVSYYRTRLTAQTLFEVLDEEPPNYISVVKDDSLKDRILRTINVSHLYERAGQDGLDGAVYVDTYDPPPVNVAFDIVIRVEGNDTVIGSLCVPKAGHAVYNDPCRTSQIREHWLRWTPVGPPFDSCEVVLRSNTQLARLTVDFFEIWEGEIVYGDVHVRLQAENRKAAQKKASEAISAKGARGAR